MEKMWKERSESAGQRLVIVEKEPRFNHGGNSGRG